MYAIDQAGRDPGRAQALSAPAQAIPAGGLSLFDLIGMVLRCWFWIALGAIAGAALAVLVAMTIQPRFMSVAQILVDPRDLRVLQNEVTPGGSLNDSTTAFLESQARVIASDKIKVRVIEELGLTKDREFGALSDADNPLMQAIRSAIGATKPPKMGDPVVMALEALDKKTWVKRNERTFVIEIGVQTEDAAKSARIANAMANAYFKDQAEVRSEVSERATRILTSRLDELRERLRDAEEKVQRFKTANDIASVGNRSVNEEQLTQAAALLAQARSRVGESRARFEQLSGLAPSRLESGSLPEAVNSNTITALRAQLGAALARESELVTLLGPSHPQMIAARSQVRDARRQIADELARIVQSAKLDHERALAAERSMVQRFEELKRDSFSTNQASVQLRELEREAEANRSVYQAFLQRAREARELVGVDTSNARIISEAMPATRSTGISRRLVVLGGAVAGAGLGLLIGLALLWGRNAQRARLAPQPVAAVPSAEAMQPASAAPAPRAEAAPGSPAHQAPRARFRPFLAQKPAVATPPAATQPAAAAQDAASPANTETAPSTAASGRSGPAWRRAGNADAASPEAALMAAGWPLLARLPKAMPVDADRRGPATSVFQDQGFVVDSLEQPGSAFAGGIAQVADALPRQAEGENRRLLVIGLAPGAGVSTVALNLALAAAQADGVPLLVDLGRGARTLTEALAPDAELGFDDVHEGTSGLVRAALQDEETGVFFLPREKGRMLPPEEIDARRIRTRLLPSMRRFDPVIIDGAAAGRDPLLATLAAEADDILLVGRAQDVTPAALAAVRASFDTAALGRIRGVVLNHG